MAGQPVADFSGQPHRAGEQGRQVDRNTGPDRRTQDIQVAEIDRVVRALPPAEAAQMALFDDQADEGDDLAQARQGRVVGHAVPVFVKAAHAGTDAQDRPAAADEVEVQGRQRRLKTDSG